MIMIGCGSPNMDDPETLDKIIAEAIDEDNFQKRSKEGEELHYAPNEQTPYTGWSKVMHDNGQIGGLKSYKDGKPDGLLTMWYENGQKSSEENYKDGNLDGLVTMWYENGQKSSEENYKDGNLDGLVTMWYSWNGQKGVEVNYNDGKAMSAVIWKPNGEKCSVTNLKDGNGVMVMYDIDGKEMLRATYKDGEEVED